MATLQLGVRWVSPGKKVRANWAAARNGVAFKVLLDANVLFPFSLRDTLLRAADGIEAQSPDAFLSHLFDLDPDRMVELVRKQAQALRNPPRRFDELLVGLAKTVPEFARNLADYVAQHAR